MLIFGRAQTSTTRSPGSVISPKWNGCFLMLMLLMTLVQAQFEFIPNKACLSKLKEARRIGSGPTKRLLIKQIQQHNLQSKFKRDVSQAYRKERNPKRWATTFQRFKADYQKEWDKLAAAPVKTSKLPVCDKLPKNVQMDRIDLLMGNIIIEPIPNDLHSFKQGGFAVGKSPPGASLI